MNCPETTLLTQMIVGDLPEAEKVRLSTHLRSCLQCRAQYEELTQIASHIKMDAAAAYDADAVKKIMTIIDEDKAPLPVAPQRRLLRWQLLVPLAALLLAGITWFIFDAGTDTGSQIETGFRARGGDESFPDQWVSLKIYEHRDSGYIPAGDSISAASALAFKYQDYSEKPWPFLMIVATDGFGHSYWYYPLYLSGQTNPRSIVTRKANGDFQLPEEVTHRYLGSEIRVFGIFSRTPLNVQSVERELKKQVETGGALRKVLRLDLPDTAQFSKLLKVE